jgi:hypothetical protein
MVAMSEIDSFFIKFKQLVYSGKNAHLDVKSEAGKAIVHLTVEVDVQHQHRAQPRNGPARQRRREKRAAAREAAEIANHEVDGSAIVKEVENTETRDVSEEDNLENVEESEVSEQETRENGKAKSAEKASKPVIEEVDDEFCSNKSYQTKPESCSSCSAAPAVPQRKLAGFDYYSMYPSDYD